MNTLKFQVSPETVIHLQRAEEDAAIKGWDRDEVELTVDGDPDQCTVEQQAEVLLIQSRAALSARVPVAARLLVGEANADLVLRDLDGTVDVEAVHGDGLLQALGGPVSLQEAHGDLTVERTRGPLSLRVVHGDVRVNKAEGAVTLGQISGDVRARDVGGALNIGAVSGDVRLKRTGALVVVEETSGLFSGKDILGGMELHAVQGDVLFKSAVTPGQTYRAHANGSITARLPEDTSARFQLQAGGALHAELAEVEEQSAGRLFGRTGSGEAQVEFQAGGDLSVRFRGYREPEDRGFEFDFGQDIAAQVEATIADSLSGIDLDALAQREVEKAVRRAEREIEKARERAEEQMQRTHERVQRAQERAARAARRAQERFRRSPRWDDMFGRPVTARAERGTRRSPASDEEQLTILRMVQKGTISIEEAEKLLKALEG
jgi:ElaB/YqjD/DUF883 family membrane-anchored ribosome-binding protein